MKAKVILLSHKNTQKGKKQQQKTNLNKIKTEELQTKAALTYSDILNNFLFFL